MSWPERRCVDTSVKWRFTWWGTLSPAWLKFQTVFFNKLKIKVFCRPKFDESFRTSCLGSWWWFNCKIRPSRRALWPLFYLLKRRSFSFCLFVLKSRPFIIVFVALATIIRISMKNFLPLKLKFIRIASMTWWRSVPYKFVLVGLSDLFIAWHHKHDCCFVCFI